MKHRDSGFTLIELMVVVAVVATLASIAVPKYQHYIERSELTAGYATLRSLTSNIDVFIAENGYFPSDTDMALIGASAKMNPLGTLNFSADESTARAIFTFDGAAAALQTSDNITLSKDMQSGQWSCSKTSLLPLKGCL